ncbi:hypothetical protein [Streptomyces zingiberis]|uniref:Uncharacterized protein n=1 Tax=Streptomyces zingiberis TaxID=2053010 RepID=A0ABX1BT28_9ACTN|nr:hypothetical protein [Streptomyces zingiberis]NJQ00856.1 hypothetical protein [Streptomyces zingiberis]
MESEILALAGTAASTLVGLMVSDSWPHIRDRIGRLLGGGRAGRAPAGELERSRRVLVAAHRDDDEEAAALVEAEWRSRLAGLLGTDPAAGRELGRLLDELGRGDTPSPSLEGVHNVVNGEVRNGPVIQSGLITGLTIHSGSGEPEPDA